MRSFTALLVTVLLAVSLAACGGGEDGDDPGGLYGDTRAAAALTPGPS